MKCSSDTTTLRWPASGGGDPGTRFSSEIRNKKRASKGPKADFFGNTRIEAEALQRQGLGRSEAFEQIRRFNNGHSDGFLFHFTNRQGGRGIVDSGQVFPTQRGLGGSGVYTGTTPVPNWFQRYGTPIGWGVNPGSNVRLLIKITPGIEGAIRTPPIPRWTRIIGEGETIPLGP